MTSIKDWILNILGDDRTPLAIISATCAVLFLLCLALLVSLLVGCRPRYQPRTIEEAYLQLEQQRVAIELGNSIFPPPRNYNLTIHRGEPW